jgi:hypothetical protein
MVQLKNSFEIYKLLEKSNCKKCGERTCLAFAGLVFQGKRQLGECPMLPPDVIERYDGKVMIRKPPENVMERQMGELKKNIQKIDLPAIAEKVGGSYANGVLSIEVLGKAYHITPNGDISSEIHINPWVVTPLIHYVINFEKDPIAGRWIKYRELPNGGGRDLYFRHRCEKVLKNVADSYTGLFNDLIHVFNGKQVENYNQSDISLVLHPLPKLPTLISYWKPDGDFESDFTFCFDSSAQKNLDSESIFTICTGIAFMFQKLSLKHT